MSIRRSGLAGGLRVPRTICATGSFDQVQMLDNPAGLWPLQGDANDISGNARHGAQNGGSWTSTKINDNGAGSYLASTSYIEIAGGAWKNNASYTFEILVYPTSFPSYACPAGWNNPPGYGLLWSLHTTSYAYDNSGGTLNPAAVSIVTSTPYLLAVRWDKVGGTVSYWKNGVKVSNTNNNNVDADHRQTLNLYIGSSHPSYYFWAGNLSYAAYYDFALSDARLLAHAQAAGLA